jgi:hypothetical protein
MFADSAFKRVQVDARAYWPDAGEPHRGPALRTGGTLNFGESNDGREALRLGHDACLDTGGSTTLSVTGDAQGGGAAIIKVCASGVLKRESIRAPIHPSRDQRLAAFAGRLRR